MPLRLLILEGNVAADRELYRAGFGKTASEAYAATVRELAPDAICEIVCPADADAALPSGAALENFDGVFVTGSSLNVYDGGPAIQRQIDVARAVFASKTPFFGSCWGLQVAAVAAGGTVVKNPRGREIGLARDIRPSAAGAAHPLLRGRAASFDAPTSHLDHVEALPARSTVLAANAVSQVQAMEIVHGGGMFWGVQYHPEYSLREIASIMARRAPALAQERKFASEAAARAYAADLARAEAEPADAGLAERLSLGPDVLDPAERRRELSNFLEFYVRPVQARRGRA